MNEEARIGLVAAFSRIIGDSASAVKLVRDYERVEVTEEFTLMPLYWAIRSLQPAEFLESSMSLLIYLASVEHELLSHKIQVKVAQASKLDEMIREKTSKEREEYQRQRASKQTEKEATVASKLAVESLDVEIAEFKIKMNFGLETIESRLTYIKRIREAVNMATEGIYAIQSLGDVAMTPSRQSGLLEAMADADGVQQAKLEPEITSGATSYDI